MCWMASTEQSLPTVKLATLDAFYVYSSWMWFENIWYPYISFLFPLVTLVLFSSLFWCQCCSSGTQAVARPSQSLVGQRTMRIVDWFRALSGWCSRRVTIVTLYDAFQSIHVHPFFGKETSWVELVKKAMTAGWSKLDRLFERDQPNTACTSRTWKYTRTLRCLFPIASVSCECPCLRSGPQLNSKSILPVLVSPTAASLSLAPFQELQFDISLPLQDSGYDLLRDDSVQSLAGSLAFFFAFLELPDHDMTTCCAPSIPGPKSARSSKSAA